MIISSMEGCSSMSPWANMYQQGGIGTPGSVSLFSDPIQEVVHRHNQGISTISHNNQPQGRGVISWGEGPPSDDDHQLPMLIGGNNMIQSQPFDATSSIDQSLECLLSGTNSNTEASDNDQDDGISMLFSSDCGKNFWNFSSNNNTQNNVNNNISNSSNNNNVVSPNETSNNPKKRSYNNIHNLEEEEEHQKFKLTSSTSPPPKSAANKRQRTSTERLEVLLSTSSNISFQQGSSSTSSIEEPDAEAIQQMKEMIYRAAAFRPVNFGADPVERPKRKNVKISSDPQTVAARQRRERISEKLRVLQKIVPGGSKMDTASMLDEAANYLKFLRNQVKDLENLPNLGNYKLDQYHFSTNTSSNIASNHPFLPPNINLQFSPMAFSMQGPHYSLPKP